MTVVFDPCVRQSGFHDSKMSRWTPLEQGRHYYIEFWQDYLRPDVDWWGGGLTSIAVRLATRDAQGRLISIHTAISELGVLETGAANCQD